ncbi:antitoxin VbhA family protein [Paenibacillus radicis (ex Xue et al. 2023)]|uniref:Antitoxin VbhA family protein n=1 Tax=Paenibacillus radicis (ex Xue et al. 2023) TaxID=2972489 RepID=A0ABT1YVH3_9BACL|nr:antitoxin VbhA family protein [Paenibacillus radicis (ex Xue et al. 2023)]MCR8636955.1 antitoxin VbhA family protein [Paenibacillus radicis (ex Xue et al. 2023)]
MNMKKEQFERYFGNLQASWGYEGMELTPEEGEQLRRVAMGEITKEEYSRSINAAASKEGDSQ